MNAEKPARCQSKGYLAGCSNEKRIPDILCCFLCRPSNYKYLKGERTCAISRHFLKRSKSKQNNISYLTSNLKKKL